MLKRVQFQGIKSLVDVTVDLEPFTVLVGQNGSGKSTILDQIELLARAAQANPETGNNIYGAAGEALAAAGIAQLRTAGRELPMLFAGWDVEGRHLSVTVQPGIAVQWSLGTRLNSSTPKGDCSMAYDSPMEARRAFTEHLASNYDWRAQRLAMSPTSIVEPSNVEIDELDPDGYGLPTILKDLAGNDTGAFLKLQEDMRKVVPHFRHLRFGKARTKDGVPLVTLDLVMSQGRIPADRASDGTRLALALLTATHNLDMPGLILMDDMDHGLHLSAQVAMVEAIRGVMAARRNLQVLCTTHSPVLLDSFKEHEVRVMALDQDGYSHVKPLTEHPRLDSWRASMGTGELWANLGEDWVTNG